MYQVTWHHASAFPQETGQLWLNVAANKRNVIPILDFVITQGLQEAAELPNKVKALASYLEHPCASQSFVLGEVCKELRRCGQLNWQHITPRSSTAGQCITASYILCGQEDSCLPLSCV